MNPLYLFLRLSFLLEIVSRTCVRITLFLFKALLLLLYMRFSMFSYGHIRPKNPLASTRFCVAVPCIHS